jgi:hypothetical protein
MKRWKAWLLAMLAVVVISIGTAVAFPFLIKCEETGTMTASDGVEIKTTCPRWFFWGRS